MKFGRITAHSHGGRVFVFLNGQDVTGRCMDADDVGGTVTLLCHDERRHDWRAHHPHSTAAHLMPDADDRLCSHMVRGDVAIVLRA